MEARDASMFPMVLCLAGALAACRSTQPSTQTTHAPPAADTRRPEPRGLDVVTLQARMLDAGSLAASAPDARAADSGTSASASAGDAAPNPSAGPIVYDAVVVNRYPHDHEAFTQGLFFHQGRLFEGTGIWGRSEVREVTLATGAVVRRRALSREHFGEGTAPFGGRLFQLTWQSHTAFVYDLESFTPRGSFPYTGEGWGLTTDGTALIMSDGSNQLRFIDPETFRVIRTIAVTDRGTAVRELNELEYVRGEVFANVWQTDRIARIDPASGRVVGWIECGNLRSAAERANDHPDAVLNGIAWDEPRGRLYVTGKLWPTLFEVELRRR